MNDLGTDTLGFILSAVVILLVFMVGILAIPLGVAGFAGLLFYHRVYKSPAALERKAQEHTQLLYEEVVEASCEPIDKMSFGERFMDLMPLDTPEPLIDPIIDTCLKLFDTEDLDRGVPEPPAICNSIEGAKYRDMLSKYSVKHTSAKSMDIAVDVVGESVLRYLNYAPTNIGESGHFDVPIRAFFGSQLAQCVEDIILPFFADESVDKGFFESLRGQLSRNLNEMSGISDARENKNHSDLILPSDYEGKDDIVDGYLKFTPLKQLFEITIPYEIPTSSRIEHSFVVGGSGHGKTSLYETLLVHDLEKVIRRECSLIVVDSQKALLEKIKHLHFFGLGDPLFKRLVIIDGSDSNQPIALNPFALHGKDFKSMPEREQDLHISKITDLFEYVFSTLLDAEMTNRQSALFSYSVQLLARMPGSSLLSFLDLYEGKKGKFPNQAVYQPYIDELDIEARKFFAEDFLYEYHLVKAEVKSRLHGVLKRKGIKAMFCTTENKVDLNYLLDNHFVILVDTDQHLLGDDGSKFLGNIIFGLIHQATTARQGVPESLLVPTFVYIDELADYTREKNVKLEMILSQARKRHFGICTAFQFLSVIDESLSKSILNNSAVRFAGGTELETKRLTEFFRTSYEYLRSLSKFSFAFWVRDSIDPAVTVKVRPNELGRLPKIFDGEYDAIWKHQLDTYHGAVISGVGEELEKEGKEDDLEPPSSEQGPSGGGGSDDEPDDDELSDEL